MKRIHLVLFLLISSTALLPAQIFDKFAATVNLTQPEAISVRQLDQRIEQIRILRAQSGLPSVEVTHQDRMTVLNMMISETLLEQGIQKAQINISQQEIDAVIENQKAMVEQQNGVRISMDQFKDAVVSQTKIPWPDYVSEIRSQLEQQKYISQERGEFIQKNLKIPTEQEIEELYQTNKNQFTNPEILRYSQFFISTINMDASKREAALKSVEKIYLMYQNGDTKFEDMENAYLSDSSLDQTIKVASGDAGFIARNDATAKAYLGDAFIRDIFKISVGTVKGILQSNIGYHIVKITEHREARILEIDDQVAPNTTTTVRQFITNQILQQKQQEVLSMAIEDLVNELRKDAEITIFEENIN